MTNNMEIDTSKIAIISYKPTYRCFKDAKPTKLTNKDLKAIETILSSCITAYNIEQQKLYKEQTKKYPEHQFQLNDFVINYKNYKRQYIPVINNKGEKEVWINCFCNDWDIEWKENMLSVYDVGNCYFNVKINLTNKTYYDLMINGEAQKRVQKEEFQ